MDKASRVLVISGSMGAGKTTVMGEASDLLLARQHRHATIDVDAIAVHGVDESVADRFDLASLRAIYDNCIAAGVSDIVAAAAVESDEAANRLREVFAASTVTICRLTATEHTLQDRLRVREPGMRQQEFLDRSRMLDRTLSDAAIEDFVVDNDDRSVTDVATDVLIRAGWIT